MPEPILPAEITWPEPAAGGRTPGAANITLLGNVGNDGIYVQRVKLAQDGRILPHTHTDERFSVVLEGSIFVGFGTGFDPDSMVEIPAGGMYVAPAGVPHYIWARTGPAIYQESGIGPSSTSFIATP